MGHECLLGLTMELLEEVPSLCRGLVSHATKRLATLEVIQVWAVVVVSSGQACSSDGSSLNPPEVYNFDKINEKEAGFAQKYMLYLYFDKWCCL